VPATLRRWKNESIRRVRLTMRHELVHVYMNSAMGAGRYGNPAAAPRWFHEGLATWVSGTAESVLSERYQGYLRVFAFLAERLGVRGLAALVGDVASGRADVPPALRKAGFGSEDELLAAAAARFRFREHVNTAFAVAFLVLIALAIVGRGVRGGFFGLTASYLAFLAASGWASATLGRDGVAWERGGQIGLALFAGGCLWLGIRRRLASPPPPVPLAPDQRHGPPA